MVLSIAYPEFLSDWELIKTHWQDLIRVVLSIRAGKLMPSIILRKLRTYNRKNRLYLQMAMIIPIKPDM